MMVTVFTDASFCPRTHAAGWGAWAKGDRWQQSVTFSGPIKAQVRNSSQAEIAAMANALVRLHNRGLLEGYLTVMLQTDNVRVLQIILQTEPKAKVAHYPDSADIMPLYAPISAIERKAAEIISDCLTNATCVLLRHVRGHPYGGGRNWVNRTCDALACKHMEEQRQELRTKKPKRKKRA